MKNQNEIINHLSIELTRTQMINKAIIQVLERKNIITEQEILDELEDIISSTVKEFSSKLQKKYEEEIETNTSFLNFTKIGKA
jgi:hypothetical protein